jgi:hypothetical protein
MLLAALNKVPERNPSLFYRMAVQIKPRLHLILSLAQILVHPMLDSRASKL